MKIAKTHIDTSCLSEEQKSQVLRLVVNNLIAQLTETEIRDLFKVEILDTDKDGTKEYVVSLKETNDYNPLRDLRKAILNTKI